MLACTGSSLPFLCVCAVSILQLVRQDWWSGVGQHWTLVTRLSQLMQLAETVLHCSDFQSSWLRQTLINCSDFESSWVPCWCCDIRSTCIFFWLSVPWKALKTRLRAIYNQNWLMSDVNLFRGYELPVFQLLAAQPERDWEWKAAEERWRVEKTQVLQFCQTLLSFSMRSFTLQANDICRHRWITG